MWTKNDRLNMVMRIGAGVLSMGIGLVLLFKLVGSTTVGSLSAAEMLGVISLVLMPAVMLSCGMIWRPKMRSTISNAQAEAARVAVPRVNSTLKAAVEIAMPVGVESRMSDIHSGGAKRPPPDVRRHVAVRRGPVRPAPAR